MPKRQKRRGGSSAAVSRNPLVRELRTPGKYRKRIERKRTIYTRKGRPPKGGCTQTTTYGETTD